MLTSITPLLAALLIQSSFTIPYPSTNTTGPSNGNSTSGTLPIPINGSVPEYRCTYIYPSDLTVLNERYPNYSEGHLHDANTLFMLRREVPTLGEIATRVQFQNLPSKASNTTCRLEFILPQPELQVLEGSNPTFDTYHVEHDTESISTWEQYVGNTEGVESFGRVNGEPEALARTRSVGSVAAINEMKCNETLTFQMGMAFDSMTGLPNYWSFVQATPPAWPEQGFRMVWGC
jgi:hypothetical protein